MKTDLNDILIFIQVIETGSFTKASVKLNISKSKVSTRISELEARLKAQLIIRTTRKLSLTEIGRLYYGSCVRVLEEVQNGEKIIHHYSGKPRGTLRISAPFLLTKSLITPLVPKFLKNYEDIHLHFDVNNHYSDLIKENIDLALSVYTASLDLPNDHVIKTFSQKLVATPKYLRKYGTPTKPDDLINHKVIARANINGESILWKNSATQKPLLVNPIVSMGEPESRAILIRNSLGIGWLPDFLCINDIQNGRLIECLSQFPLPSATLIARTPNSRSESLKVKAFIDFIEENL